ncbi:MAG: DNA mismatch repair protein MutS, partial [Sphingobacteriia bacterium]
LELFPSGREGAGETNLLQVMDLTLTPMGGRLLRRWMAFPLQDLEQIQGRTQAVSAFLLDQDLRHDLRQSLRACGDLERLVSKVSLRKINPREVLHLARTLVTTATIKEKISASQAALLAHLCALLDPLTPLQNRILHTLEDEPALALNKGKSPLWL